MKGTKVEDFVGGQEGIIGTQVQALEETKEPIKKSIAATIAKKHRIREIESDNKRTVQFLFDPQVKTKIAPFTRKYLRFIEGNLTQFENEEREKFENYIQAIEGESIEGGNDEYNVLKYNPIVFENMPMFHFELTNLNSIAFQVADDPFFKSVRARYYPEVVVMNMSGKVKAKVNPFSRKYIRKGREALLFEDDFRESKLKINDDRRVQIFLSALQPKERAPPSMKESVMSGNPNAIQT